jgi:hypothetical protein
LVLTPESQTQLRPLVETILAQQPKIKNWEFYGYRLPEDFAETKLMVQARVQLDITPYTVRVSKGEHQLINLKYESPTIIEEDDQEAFHAAFVATETLLGEKRMSKWIGVIETAPATKSESRAKGATTAIPLDRLAETVEALVQSIQEQLPESSHAEQHEDAKWSLWELKPEEAEDYPAQNDLIIGGSMNSEIWRTFRQRVHFDSLRFSKLGEKFCYLKMDGQEGLTGCEFDDRGEIEEALDEVLKPNKLGCHIGGGTGLRYSYIDFALMDLDNGIDAIRKRLQKSNLPKRSWIQFFDSELAAEWVGIYDDTPAPPMPAEED